jgi:hypothetical protein
MGLYLNSPENLQTYPKAMNDPNPRWRDLYEAALLELDRGELLRSIELAEQAIREQANAIGGTSHDPDERLAMEDALRALSLLRRSALRG